MAGKTEEKAKKEASKQSKKEQDKKKQKPKYEYENYLIFLHKQPVEVHVAYGNTVVKFQGILRAKSRYDIQLILDEKKKDIIIINKGFIIAVKPLK
ncbi:MAG: hypothetical protein DSY32_04925 [Aquifex sp.]|nr:MAG: hypothetical protein DSY32_04925 [Aquifex sp.]